MRPMALVGVGHHRLQQAHQPGQHRLHRGRLEQVGAVLDDTADALGTLWAAAFDEA